jgi:hypothetical protein
MRNREEGGLFGVEVFFLGGAWCALSMCIYVCIWLCIC